MFVPKMTKFAYLAYVRLKSAHVRTIIKTLMSPFLLGPKSKQKPEHFPMALRPHHYTKKGNIVFLCP